ncbi:tetratricopeptide repeat protein [Methanobrevibacter filiformis]|uniref:Tetratricopeptide repeat protein n=1 Tax=Methanobrevibacter filiformis TaxID=55758 RepID=A0A165YXW1_9EURY|nr:hypothetical protein [Methanobrevibacter filiformis]KZX10001.1 tetratricopeptide repeat protein [Methanobrevibacter filiformis]
MSKISKEKLLKKLRKEYNASNHVRAIKIANQLLKLDSNQHEVYFLKIASLTYLNKNEECLKTCKQALEKNSNDMNFICKISQFLREFDKNEESLLLLKEAFKLNPENKMIMENLLYTLFNVGGFEKAFEFIDNFPKEDPLWLDCLFFKAQLFSMEFMYEESLDACNNVLNHDPHHLDALSKKIFVLSKLERLEEAYEIIEFRIKNNLRPKGAKVDKAIYLAKKNNSSDALDILDEVLDEDPNFSYALSTKANFAHVVGEDVLALEYINKAIKNEDSRNHDHNLIIKSLILSGLGLFDEAFDYLDQISEDSPHVDAVIKATEEIEEKLANLEIVRI